MATQSTKTYLQFVNEAIDEAGAELALFAEDGSDWNTQSDPMMNRFKKWVKRAWKEIQQEANDWDWLEETAVVNITPGIMFYSPTPITMAPEDITPLTIYDVDGTPKVTGLTVSQVKDLTGKYSKSKPFGYINCLYSDYSFNNQHPLDFGMKAGGEYFKAEPLAPSFHIEDVGD